MNPRPASAADTEPVRRLVHLAFAHYTPRIGEQPAPMTADYDQVVAQGRCWVVEEDGRLVGMVQLATAPGHLTVETIAVAPDAQGRGIGARLLTFAENRARALGLPEVRLYTNEAMTENLAYYPRRGYREIGRETRNGFRRVLFAKPIPAAGSDAR